MWCRLWYWASKLGNIDVDLLRLSQRSHFKYMPGWQPQLRDSLLDKRLYTPYIPVSNSDIYHAHISTLMQWHLPHDMFAGWMHMTFKLGLCSNNTNLFSKPQPGRTSLTGGQFRCSGTVKCMLENLYIQRNGMKYRITNIYVQVF